MQDNTGSDENMEDDRRQESHIASVVAKIKTEKKDNIGIMILTWNFMERDKIL